MDKSTQGFESSITFRVSKTERDHLQIQAELAGLSLSNLIRMKIKNIRIIPRIEQHLINELRKQGGLLKNNFETIRHSSFNNVEKARLLALQEKLLSEIILAVANIEQLNKGHTKP